MKKYLKKSWLNNSISFLETASIGKKTRMILFYASIVVTFVAIFALNMQQPLFTDDWEYTFCERVYNHGNRAFASDERIETIGDIVTSQHEHYFSWGGRNTNHFIAQVLLLIGSPYNKVLNSLAYVALTYLVYLFAKRRTEKHRLSLYFFINILIFFFQPFLGATTIWITGSANYLWGMLIVLTFLLPYKTLFERISNEEDKEGPTIILTFLMFPLGVIAGWANENIVAIIIPAILFFSFYVVIRKEKIPGWFFTGFTGCVTGIFLFISTLINYNRSLFPLETTSWNKLSTTELLVKQFSNVASSIFFYLSVIISIYFILLLVFKYCKRPQSHNYRTLSFAAFVYAIAATLVMGFFPISPERALFGIIIFLIIGIAILYNNLDFKILALRNLRTLTYSLAAILLLGYYISGYRDLGRTKTVFDNRERIMNEQKEKGITDFVFENEIESKSRLNHMYELSCDPTYRTNCFYARYHGVNSVRVVNPKCNKLK